MRLGIDQFSGFFSPRSNARLAMVTNNAATTGGGELSRVAVLKQGFNLVKLFSPEHGMSAHGEDGAFQQDGFDEVTRLPVISLYGKHLAPSQQDLRDVDTVIYDIPDVGCRFYTFQWTLSHVMEACAQFGRPLVVLDRPNPIGGSQAISEGPMLNPGCQSFLGRMNIPIRHGLTTGEFARLWQQRNTPQLQLTVIPVHGWERRQAAPAHHLPFVPPSPGIPCLETALLYPGMALLEGISVNEGRGTTLPFRVCGAPFINAAALTEAVNGLNLPGVKALPYSMVPAAGLYMGLQCHGIQWVVMDATALRPVFTALCLIKTLMAMYPAQIAERPYPTNANPSGHHHLDRLLGQPDSFSRLKRLPINDLPGFINEGLAQWQNELSAVLLYP